MVHKHVNANVGGGVSNCGGALAHKHETGIQ
jgi:hypothetical protein